MTVREKIFFQNDFRAFDLLTFDKDSLMTLKFPLDQPNIEKTPVNNAHLNLKRKRKKTSVF